MVATKGTSDCYIVEGCNNCKINEIIDVEKIGYCGNNVAYNVAKKLLKEIELEEKIKILEDK